MTRNWKQRKMADYLVQTVEEQLMLCLNLDHFQGVAVWGALYQDMMDAMEEL